MFPRKLSEIEQSNGKAPRLAELFCFVFGRILCMALRAIALGLS